MEAPDYKALEFWFSVGQWVFNVAVALYLYNNRKHTATNTRVDKLERDVIRVCADMDNLPGRSEFAKLGDEIKALTGELSETKGRLGGINRAVDLINEFLINQGAKR